MHYKQKLQNKHQIFSSEYRILNALKNTFFENVQNPGFSLNLMGNHYYVNSSFMRGPGRYTKLNRKRNTNRR